MKAATTPPQRPSDARILIVGRDGRLNHVPRERIADHLDPGDLLVANDAATIPATLTGFHERTGSAIEVRLAGRRSLMGNDVREFTAIVFGGGDYRTRTEDRPLPPALRVRDVLILGPLTARVLRQLGHPRLVVLSFNGSPDTIWSGLAVHGKPIQYAHIEEPLAMWDVWTRVAALPVSFEPPSAGFALDWRLLTSLQARDIAFATVTHAAGISSTGDPTLDARLPFDEPYRLPGATVRAIATARSRSGRVIAVGTTVTRALEHAASQNRALTAGAGLATQRIGPDTTLRVVDAIITGAHEPGESHYELLRAFADDALLRRASTELEQNGYRSHEFGDSLLVFRRQFRPQIRQQIRVSRA